MMKFDLEILFFLILLTKVRNQESVRGLHYEAELHLMWYIREL